MSSYQSATIVAAPNEFQLDYPIHVPVSKVQFCPEPLSRLLAVTGWDGLVHVYQMNELNNAEEKKCYFHPKAVLACAFVGEAKIASAGLDQAVKMVDIESGNGGVGERQAMSITETTLGGHALGIRCLEYSRNSQMLVSGSWDSSIKLWDTRQRVAANDTKVSDRVYAMDVHGNEILVGTKDRKIYLYDVRRMDKPEQTRDSPLKFQTRALSFFPTGEAFVVSSIEGRVAVEYIGMDQEEQKKKYAFKCHRDKGDDGTETIYPVNALSFHPRYGTFATGGSDAMVNIWDPFNRKRLIQLHSAEGGLLAIAASYGREFEQDPVPLPDNLITIRSVSESECRTK